MDDPWYSKLVVSTPGPTTETAAKTMLDVHTASSESQREVIALQRKILEVEFSAGRQTLERDFSILLNDLFTRFSNAEIRLLHSSLGEVQQLRNDDRFTFLSMVSVFGTFMQTVKNWDSFTVNALRRFVNDLVTINCDTFATLSAERAEAVTRSELINDLEERLIKFQILHCNDKSMSSEQNVQSTPSSSSEDHSPHDLTSLKGVNLRLQNEVNTLTTSLMKEREHTTLLTCQLSDLEESVAQIRSESNVIEIERNEFNARVVELEKQVESVANALKEARSSNEKLQQQSRDYHSMYLRQLDETEHLSQSFEKLHSSYNEKIETELSFEKYVNGGSNDDPSVDFSNEVQNLKKKVREQAQTIAAQQLKMQDIEIELDMFRTGVPLRHEMVQLEQHLAESNEECENLHQELDVTLRELSEERVHVARITSRIMELESSIVTNKSIQEEIERNLELERTRSEELKRALSNLEHSGTVVNSERGRLESELSTLKRQLTEEQLKSRTASHRATQLEQELNLLTQELENALRTCSNERAVSAQVTSRVRELESLIASMKSDNYKSHSNPQDVSSSGQHSTGPRIGSNNTGMENVDAM